MASSHELKCWHQEARAACLYFVLSDAEAGTPRQLVFLELANEAKEQAALWAVEARKNGMVTPEYTPDRLVKTVTWFIQKCGTRSVKPLLAWLRLRGLAMFSRSPHHALGQQNHPVFDFNDGLFALALLTISVASTDASHGVIVLIGVAGLLAGAIATAAGEYLATSQANAPGSLSNLEHEELTRIYQARGMSQQQASELAIKVMADPDVEAAESILEETRPEPVVQIPIPPMQVALRAFFAFVAGGIVPLAPYLLNAQRYPLLVALVLSAVGVIVTGAMMASLTGRTALWGGFRALGVGVLAGLVSGLVGEFVGGLLK
jgi:vacuolar iron transporter family protein